MPRLFPIIILLILTFVGGTYFIAMSNQAQTTTVIQNNTSVSTGWSLLTLGSGFVANNIAILALLGFLVLFIAILALLRGGGE